MALAVGSRAAEELWRHHAAANEVINLAAARIEDDRLARIGGRLTANLREERGKAVVVVHRPAVERMVMALGTLNPHAHKYLGHVFRNLEPVLLHLVIVRGRI